MKTVIEYKNDDKNRTWHMSHHFKLLFFFNTEILSVRSSIFLSDFLVMIFYSVTQGKVHSIRLGKNVEDESVMSSEWV